MAYMRDVDGNRLDDMHVQKMARDLYQPPLPLPLNTDAVVNINDVFDPMYDNGFSTGAQYTIDGSLPALFPIRQLGGIPAGGGGYSWAGNTINPTTRTLRFLTDGDRFAVFSYVAGFTPGIKIYVDGEPTSVDPYEMTVGFVWSTVQFPDSKARTIEIVTAAQISGIYTIKPYAVWACQPYDAPRVLVCGDSWAAGVGASDLLNGMYADIGPLIGARDVWLDAIGGTGYGVTYPPDTDYRYLDRLGPRAVTDSTVEWDYATIQPDMIWVHGGGANDFGTGRTEAQVIADATTFFTEARAKCPDAKLVFVEGMSSPDYPLGEALRIAYIHAREGLQTNMGDELYYIDVATTSPWMTGSGSTTDPHGDGNADVYMDGVSGHPSDAGHAYMRTRVAGKMREVLKDQGQRLGQLI